MAKVVQKTEQRLSNWVVLTARAIASAANPEPQVFHSLQQADYVNVLALTTDGRIPLVRQFRPALERFTLEFPGGLLEKGEEPESTAVRELFEETGLKAPGTLTFLGCLSPDTGRLENRLWCYFVDGVDPAPVQNWEREHAIETQLVTKAEFLDLVLKGEFDHALNIAGAGLAVMRGLIQFS